ncbi:MAG: hypothetical protein NTV04_13255 [Deltaproteobacteria bacterium]|nr:hypothetical protein [Deltaproteobacteria bacterium]
MNVTRKRTAPTAATHLNLRIFISSSFVGLRLCYCSTLPHLFQNNNPLSKQRKGDPIPPAITFSSNPSTNFNAQFPLFFQPSIAEYMKAVSRCQAKNETAKNEIFLKETHCHSEVLAKVT